MCVIACSKSNERLTHTEITQMFAANDDGAGMAFAYDGVVYVNKGYMTVDDFLRAYDAIPAVVPVICHFRLATYGSVCEELTHPFICSPRSPVLIHGSTRCAVLAHNGHLADYSTIALASMASGAWPSGEMSDSRLIARLVGLHGRRVLDYIGSDRIAILSPDGKFRLSGTWQEMRPGLVVSNLFWKRETRMVVGTRQVGVYDYSAAYSPHAAYLDSEYARAARVIREED